MLRLLGALCVAALLAACGANSLRGDMAVLTGSIVLEPGVELPADAAIRVQLVDVSRTDAGVVVVSELTLYTNGSQGPFHFAIDYGAAQIDDSHTYALQAHVAINGWLRFIHDRRHPVITRGAPVDVEVRLRAVSGG